MRKSLMTAAFFCPFQFLHSVFAACSLPMAIVKSASLQMKDAKRVMAENLHEGAVSEIGLQKHSNHRSCIEPIKVGREKHSANADLPNAVRKKSIVIQVACQIHAGVVVGAAHLDGFLITIDSASGMPEHEPHFWK